MSAVDRNVVDRASETRGWNKLSRDYYRPNASARAFKADKDTRREGGVRIYSTMACQAWTLQVRGPLGIGYFGLKDGKDFVIAGASLGVAEMKELRDAINAQLRACGEAL